MTARTLTIKLTFDDGQQYAEGRGSILDSVQAGTIKPGMDVLVAIRPTGDCVNGTVVEIWDSP